MTAKVILVSTGGTIASRFDAKLGRTVASARGEDLLAQVPQLGDVADLEIDDFATIPSFDLTIEAAHRLAMRVNEQLAREEVSGVVVTHGTDTMEESCYLVDLLLASDKPAVFTGAQRAHDDPTPDGPKNLLAAVRTAAAPEARGTRRGDLLRRPDPRRARRDQDQCERARHLSVLRQGRARRDRRRARHRPSPPGAAPDLPGRAPGSARAAGPALPRLRRAAHRGGARGRCPGAGDRGLRPRQRARGAGSGGAARGRGRGAR